MTKKYHILFLNGPNLNLLGTREPDIYGSVTLACLIVELAKLSNMLGINFTHFQSNAENELINWIHQSCDKDIDFIVINPAALTHTSIAIRDALLAINIPFIEIHLSNIYKREQFRHHSYLSDIAIGVICGFGIHGYFFAAEMAIKYLSLSK
ncbi:type II 3-dehydroquinate dehydratase [Blochmannia endosymbiont of Camponotus (Colobopsis) obliquus]|uniref:type II 3-dehydroquinate dehydratase n=1 Tax=Blochmannia endosymbiont of Camponotus (Colobopsis) obliquus TaxID=1505597 RepID=UPI00061A80C6|nr:type II 3-dehydroquinate dehydratase [Blochmannia endosymbiont of Camponotus (Colobopsis) obliquus]AKC60459.1 3-dehydroquinate dehydratase [Blochmannia endosymbiont of Camponotus (Colobopsis) obliquus]